MKFVGNQDPDNGADGCKGKCFSEVEQGGLHQIVERSIRGQGFRQQRTSEYQEVDEKEQANEERNRSAPVRLDVRIEPVRGHDVRSALTSSYNAPKSAGLERRPSEFHTWCLFKLRPPLAKIEEDARLEAERSGKQRSGKLLNSGVVFLHRVVEEPARRRKLVFDVRQFGLQLLEVLIGLE